MTRRAIVGFVAVACGVPASLRAQNIQLIPAVSYSYDVDTAFTIPVGGTRGLQIYGIVSGGVSAYSLTLFFDTTRIRVVRADSVAGYGLPAPTVTPLADGVTLSAAGTGVSYNAYLAALTLEMKATATQGSMLSVRVNQWTDQTGAPVAPWTLTTPLKNSCLARALWGDPDSSLTVTGRDALIALTYAVQLPVTGFGVSLADVDADSAVTSRDALMMLAYTVRSYDYYGVGRAGLPIASACAPLAGVPSDMVFIRDDVSNGTLYRVPAGDSIAVPIGSATQFGDVTQFARWAPDGSKVLATAYTSTFSYEPIAVTLSPLAEDTLAQNSASDGWGTYSPDGTRIAFFSTRASPYLWLMNADGSNPVQAQTTNTVVSYTSTNPAWSPDGQRVAFIGDPVGSSVAALLSVRLDSSAVRVEFPASTSYLPLHPSWSAAGDSLLFLSNNIIYTIAAPDTATVPRRAVPLDVVDYPSWTSAGIVFRWRVGASQPATWDYYLKQPDGRIVRIYRSGGTYDVGASFR
jgi:hypothetical protein